MQSASWRFPFGHPGRFLPRGPAKLWADVPRYRPVVLPYRNASTIFSNAIGPRQQGRLSTSYVSLQDGVIDEEAQILNRANSYGITSLSQLAAECNLARGSLRDRLISKPHYRQDLALWTIILDFVKLRKGREGLNVVFQAMMHGQPIELNDDSPAANYIWHELLSAASQSSDKGFSKALYAKHGLGWKRPNFFVEVVGKLLQNEREVEAAAFCYHFQASKSKGKEDLLQIYQICHDAGSEGLHRFSSVHKMFPLTSIYAETLPRLWQEQREDDALYLHDLLTSRGDMPPGFEHLEPFIIHFARQGKSPELFLRKLRSAGVSFDGQARRAFSRERSRAVGISRDSLNIVASNTLGVKPTKLSDSFIARAFATEAVSFEFILNGLRLWGMVEVGPLSIRQIGLSAADIEDFAARLARLDALEIDTGSSVYVRVIKELCKKKHFKLIEQVLSTDMHHEAFEDFSLQRRLLVEHFNQRDWEHVSLSLAILNHGVLDHSARQLSIDLLMRAALNLHRWRDVLHLMAFIGQSGDDLTTLRPNLPTTRLVLKYLITKLLPQENATGQDQGDYVDSARFVVGIYQELMATGNHIPLLLWREPLRALGQSGDFDEFTSVMFWLCDWYSPNGLHAEVLQHPLHGEDLNLSRLFDKGFQAAFVSWAFRASRDSLPQADSPEPWQQVLVALKRLAGHHAVHVEFQTIRKAYLEQIKSLVNTIEKPGILAKRLQSNKNVVQTMIQTLYTSWQEETTPESQRLDREFMEKTPMRYIPPHYRPVQEHATRRSQRTSQGNIQQKSIDESDRDDADVVFYQDLFHPSYKDEH